MTNKNDFLNQRAHFTWSFGKEFFIVINNKENYIWNDPEYGGDNTIKKFDGTYNEWCWKIGIPYGRDKGDHIIKNYCGEDVELKF